jgi:hypothetical protein
MTTSNSTRGAAGATRRGDVNGARAGKAKRHAWFLAGLAVFFYAAYMAWMVLRANGGV